MIFSPLRHGVRDWRCFDAACFELSVLFAMVLLLVIGNSSQASTRTGGEAVVIEVEGAIGPATSDFLSRELERAAKAQASIIILRLDTPGGLDSSTREIIQDILASPVPVASYVAPAGSRAASAGTYIVYASHLAAMAPGTNLGAATPVQIGGIPGMPDTTPAKPADEERDEKGATEDDEATGEAMEQDEQSPQTASAPMKTKMINDARAFIRSLAQLRERNVDWAESAVTEAATLSAEEALERGVIEIVAVDERSLLEQANGRVVKLTNGETTLQTADLVVIEVVPDLRYRILAIITNPQVAYVLMLLGIYGLFFELSNPGALLPGVLGGICLLLALFAFQVLPTNYAGLALVVLGMMFMVAEAFVPSFGVLGLGGLVAFVVGSLMLWEDAGPGLDVPVGLISGFAIASVALLSIIGRLMLRQRRRPVVSGREKLEGSIGIALQDFDHRGPIRVQGERWTAECGIPLRKGEQVRIKALEGLVLTVEPTEEVIK